MNTKTKKIAAACFAGAAVCGALLAMLSPAFAWLGFLSGACVGYVGYEFRAFWRAVPIALSAACGGFWGFVCVIAGEIREVAAVVFESLLRQLTGPHPIAKISIVATSATIVLITAEGWALDDAPGSLLGTCIAALIVVPCAVVVMLNVLVGIGQQWRKHYVATWTDHAQIFSKVSLHAEDEDQKWRQGSENYEQYVRQEFAEAGYTCAEPTVWNVISWVAVSPLVPLRSLLRGIPVFFQAMFHLIHSSERVICALDSVIGGALGWWLLRGDPSAPIWLVSACCGAIGAAVGLLHARLAEWLVARARTAAA